MILICAVIVSGAGLLYGSFRGIIDSAPKEFSLAPKYSATIVYDDDNKQVQQLSDYSSNRIPVAYEQIPDNLKNAFIYITVEIHIVIKPESDIKIFFLVGQITVHKPP